VILGWCRVGWKEGEREMFVFIQPFTRVYKNCTNQKYFISTVRVFGFSFQLAITATRVNVTVYGLASALR